MMKKRGNRFRKHLAELRIRIKELERYADKRYYPELKSLVTWIGRNNILKVAILSLKDRERVERDKLLRSASNDLFGLASSIWKDIDSRLVGKVRKDLDSIVSIEMQLKVDQFAKKLTSSFDQNDKDRGVDLTHQIRYLVQALAKSEYKNLVSDYVTIDGFFTGLLQTKFKEYVELSNEYDKLKENSSWGDWQNLQWVFNRLSFGLAVHLFEDGSSKLIRKDDDVFRLKRISQFIFDFYEGLVSEDVQESDSKETLDGRIWGNFRMDDEVLCIGEYGKLEFDPKKRQDGGEDGEGTSQAKFLKEVIETELSGIDRARVKSIDGNQISARINRINDRLLHAYIKKEITRKCLVASVGDRGKARLYFCVYDQRLLYND